MTASDIRPRFVDGPSGPPGRVNLPLRKWEARLAPLRSRPGCWADMGLHNPGRAHDINNGWAAGIAAGEFEAINRSDEGTGSNRLFVRYVGLAAAGDDR